MEVITKEEQQIHHNLKNKKNRKLTKLFSILTACLLAFLTFFTITWFVGSSKILDYIQKVNITASANENVIISKDVINQTVEIDNKTGRELKILQLSDIHFACSVFRYNLDKKVTDQIVKCVNKNNPDIIVISGDALSPIWITSGTRNSKNQLDAFISLFEKIGIPYTFCFGNHDPAGTLSKECISKKLEKAPTSFYIRGDRNIKGEGNYSIKIYQNGVLSSSFIFMDSGGRDGIGYEGVSASQVEWYEKEILKLKAEKTDIKNLLFMHVPIPEYDSFYSEAKKGNSNYEITMGTKGEAVCNGKQCGLYEKMAELNCTKWVYVGHDHKNSYSVLDKTTSITLSYGMGMDYTAYPTIKHTTKYRGGRVILLLTDGNIESYLVKQDNNYERI